MATRKKSSLSKLSPNTKFFIVVVIVLAALMLFGGGVPQVAKFYQADQGIYAKVAITSITPADGSTVSGVTTINVSSTGSPSKLEFLIDGKLAFTDTSSPYAYSWDTTKVTNGNHTILVELYNKADKLADSKTIIYAVFNKPLPPTPVVKLTSPSRETNIPITTNMILTFSEPMDLGSVIKAFSLYKLSSSGGNKTKVGCFISWNANVTQMTFRPDTLAYSTTYEITLMPMTAKSKAGGYITTSNIWFFKTEMQAIPLPVPGTPTIS